MTKRTTINSSRAPEAVGAYSQAVSFNGLLFCSGQVPIDPETGKIVDGSCAVQAKQCLENLEAVAEAAGATLAQAVRVGIYLTDMANFESVDAVYAGFFPSDPPSRATIGVAALPKGAQVEMDAVIALES